MLNKMSPNKTDIAVSFRYSLDSKCVSLEIQFKQQMCLFSDTM